MKIFLPFTILTAAVLSITSCTSDKALKEQISKVIQENPTLLADAIEKHPVEVMTALQNASRAAQTEMAKQRDAEEKKALESSYDKPLQANIRNDDVIVGPKDAPITLVEYSDFECPYCSRGFSTVKELMKKYDGKIRFVYKHLPLSIHPQAMISAQYYEALRLQDSKKAVAFHDEVFQNQDKLKGGEKYLDSVVKKVGGDLAKVKKSVKSDEVSQRIKADMSEAETFGMQGTPGFLVNGVPVRGAYPAEYFVSIIDELQKRGKIKI